MQARAIARFVRVSPRKVRQVLDIIRGKKVENAFAILDSVKKGAAFYVRQVLKSALDGAVKKTKGQADASNLYISKITANAGPMWKRWKAGSMGRGMPIKKRTSHILVELDAMSPSATSHQMPAAGVMKKQQKPGRMVKHPAKKSETKAKAASKK